MIPLEDEWPGHKDEIHESVYYGYVQPHFVVDTCGKQEYEIIITHVLETCCKHRYFRMPCISAVWSYSHRHFITIILICLVFQPISYQYVIETLQIQIHKLNTIFFYLMSQ